MKYVVSPIYPISDKLDVSHRAGWARYWAKELGAELITTATMQKLDQLSCNDKVYLYHGMEWNGALNLQGGLSQEVINRASRLMVAARNGVSFISLDCPMPQYGELLAVRGYAQGGLLDKLLKNKRQLVPHPTTDRLISGDSHALSQYVHGSVIHRTDGKTLNGVLKAGLIAHISNWMFETDYRIKTGGLMTLYFGNIDIRHHLMRTADPVQAAKDLVKEYVKQATEAAKIWKIQLEVVAPLPIENISRQLPKTGWFKDKPYFGSWTERTKLSKVITQRLGIELKKHGHAMVKHPAHFTNRAGELDFEVMEKPRSVHIRPSEYRLVQGGRTW